MPRLIYQGDTTDTFGKFLPTPVIERIKISSVSSDDIIVEQLAAAMERPSEGETHAPLDVNQLVKVDIRTSALFNSNDTFDSLELFEELFDKNENDSLYINFVVFKSSGLIDALKEDKTNLQAARNKSAASNLSNLPYSEELPPSDMASYAAKMLNAEMQIYSVPLSDYITVENFTSDFDENGNPVIKSSYANFTFHMKDFVDRTNITIFAMISTEDFSVLSKTNLSKTAFAINFSDISYEDIKVNGKLAKFGDPVYVNSGNIPYPNTPLLGLDGKYYKSDNITHSFVKSEVKVVTNKYYNDSLASNNPLIKHINNIEYVITKFGDTIDFIPNLYKANNLSSSKSSATTLGRMYDDLRLIINNINSSLIAEEQVVKRIYRNYKLIDVRTVPDIVFNSSYDEDIASDDSEFIYPNILHSAAARYVPVTDSADSPFNAEIPITPAEVREGIDAEVDALVNELVNMISDAAPTTLGDLTFDTPDSRLNKEKADLQDFLARWPQRWTRNVGTYYVDQGRNKKKHEKKVKKFAEEGNRDYSKISTKQHKEMKWWFMRDKMFEVVMYDYTEGERTYSTWTGRFDLDTKVVCSLYPPVFIGEYSGKPPYYLLITPDNSKDTSQRENWDASVILEKIIDEVKRESGSDDPIQNAMDAITDSFRSILLSSISGFRDDPNLLSQLMTEANRDEIALNIWNTFSADIASTVFKEFSNKFDALIRCVYYPDPSSGVTQKPDYYYLEKAGGYDYGTNTYAYNKFKQLAKKRSSSEWYYPITIGTRIAQDITNPIYLLKSEFISKIEAVLERIAILEGSGIDDGTFNALSKIDIIVKKSGYFFFDLEKFIRKKSFMSRFIDVDTLINFFPAGKELTNNCINIHRVTYFNDVLDLNLRLENIPIEGDSYEPTDFSTLRFECGVDSTYKTLVYKKAPIKGSTMTYSDFFNDDDGENNFDSDYFDSLSTKNEYSWLVKRNYGFAGFNDGDLPGDLTWKDDYRLACYNYQYFIDDDQHDRAVTTVDGTFRPLNKNSTRDRGNISVTIRDNSLLCLKQILDNYTSVYENFTNSYYTKAVEFCSYNEYSQRFNNFFTDAILSEFPDSSPWIDMVSTYILYLSLFTDFFKDSTYGDRLEFAEKILEQIRPETGTLGQLIEFNESLQNLQDSIDSIKFVVEAFIFLDYGTNITIRTDFDIEVPVLDHIGDYTEISERVSS